MSWHGILVRFWKIDTDTSGASPREEKQYYDHLCSTDNKQNKGAVVSLLEAAMIAIKRDLPVVSELVVQSDNASNYQNTCMILLLPVIGAAHGFWIKRYIHTETQDGKSVLDAHFAQAGRQIGRWIQQGNNCLTPTQLIVAMTSNGGLPNTLAELVEYNRPAITSLLEYIALMEKRSTRSSNVRTMYFTPNPLSYNQILLC